MNLSDPIVRAIRTVVPTAVAILVANFPFLDGVFNTDALIGVAIGAYYLLAAFLENRVHPLFGWLLGMPKDVV